MQEAANGHFDLVWDTPEGLPACGTFRSMRDAQKSAVRLAEAGADYITIENGSGNVLITYPRDGGMWVTRFFGPL